jgi:NADPH2:quinone reductase
MKAIVIDEQSPDRSLQYESVPDPDADRHQLLVAVRAASVNRADLRRSATHFAATDKKGYPIAGVELAGEVVKVGSDVTGFSVGDRVMAMAGAAFAELAAIDFRFAIPVPSTMSWEAAAATPVSFITAHNAMITAGKFKIGDSVLVQGASSGAGIATVQIARLRGASTIFGTAGNEKKLRQLRELGCDVTINYHTDDLPAVVNQHTQSQGARLIVDYAGGDTLAKSITAASIHGRIVCAGRVAGTEVTFNIDEFSRKQLEMTGVTNRTRTLEERTNVVKSFVNDLYPYFEDGSLRPLIDRTFSLSEAEAAFVYMTSNQHFGKIVLKV